MKKKIVSISLVVMLIAIAAIGGTMAFFSDTSDKAQNIFTFGKVDIELTEPKWVKPESVVPNQVVEKDPTVTVQSGSEPCWVRVNVEVYNTDVFKVAEGTDLTNYFKGFVSADWTLASKTLGTDSAVYSYYYNTIMEEGDSATLFTSVVIPDIVTVNGKAAKNEFQIDVTAYAVQAEGFATAAAAFTAEGI